MKDIPRLAIRQELDSMRLQARLDLPALIARFGDMPSDRFRMRLRCSKCGGRARLIISWKG